MEKKGGADLSKIEEGLYLGNLIAATEPKCLEEHFISHILTVDSKPLPTSVTSLPGMSFLYIKANDLPQENLLIHFEDAINFIEEAQTKGSVLVHCFFGVSRSATLVTCFLMKKYKITFDEALGRIKARRGCVGPNSGFLQQLYLFQNMEWKLAEDNFQFRAFLLKSYAFAISKGRKVDEKKYQCLVQPDPRTTPSESPVIYKCRMCRSSLVRKDSIMPHCDGQSPFWNDTKWAEPWDEASLCTQGIFTLPISWMADFTSELKGKLMCPKCQAKLGSYDWCGGKCPCGAKITPAFFFIPSKVDKCT